MTSGLPRTSTVPSKTPIGRIPTNLGMAHPNFPQVGQLKSGSHGKVSEKLKRRGKKIIATIELNKGLKCDLIMHFIAIIDARVQEFVILFDGTLGRLANNDILSRVHTISEISFIGRKRIRISPALEIRELASSGCF